MLLSISTQAAPHWHPRIPPLCSLILRHYSAPPHSQPHTQHSSPQLQRACSLATKNRHIILFHHSIASSLLLALKLHARPLSCPPPSVAPPLSAIRKTPNPVLPPQYKICAISHSTVPAVREYTLTGTDWTWGSAPSCNTRSAYAYSCRNPAGVSTK